jgi:hypothetical protein
MKAVISAVLVAVGSLIGSLVGTVVLARPAHADAAEYLRLLDDKYSYLTTQQLLTEGYKVCAALNNGVVAADAVQMVQKDLGGVTLAVSDDIVGAAAVGLGC